MPVAYLNNAVPQDAYTDALTVHFPFGRPAFSLNVSSAAIMYQLAIVAPSGRGVDWETAEHRLDQSFNRFSDPAGEGFPQGAMFAGVRVRNAVPGYAANVTVM